MAFPMVTLTKWQPEKYKAIKHGTCSAWAHVSMHAFWLYHIRSSATVSAICDVHDVCAGQCLGGIQWWLQRPAGERSTTWGEAQCSPRCTGSNNSRWADIGGCHPAKESGVIAHKSKRKKGCWGNDHERSLISKPYGLYFEDRWRQRGNWPTYAWWALHRPLEWTLVHLGFLSNGLVSQVVWGPCLNHSLITLQLWSENCYCCIHSFSACEQYTYVTKHTEQ